MLKISYTKRDGEIESFEIPTDLLENKQVWDEVISYSTWCKELTDSERLHLNKFLPDLPQDVQSDNIEQLFTGKEFRFNTNPCNICFYQLQGLLPQFKDKLRILANDREVKTNKFMTSYYNNLLSELIASRKRHLSGEKYEQEKKKLQKAQRELNRGEKLTYDTDRIKKERLKYLQQLPLPPLPEMTQAEIDARVQEIMDRVGYVRKSNKKDSTSLPRSIKNRPKIKIKSKQPYQKKSMKVNLISSVKPQNINYINKMTSHKSYSKKSLKSLAFPSDSGAHLVIKSEPTSFFGLIKKHFYSNPLLKISLKKLKSAVDDWMNKNVSGIIEGSTLTWVKEINHWSPYIQSALCYLAVETGAYSSIDTPEGFYPVVELKDRIGEWQWIRHGRDKDEDLAVWCRHWLDNLSSAKDHLVDYTCQPPRPPLYPSDKILKLPKPEEEIQSFQKQEWTRYQNPHQAYLYNIGGMKSSVSPVKGVVSREKAGFKVREHALLDSSRPPCVTILTLVRDAMARLPNGEGTRQDICHLAQESQFISNSATDQHVNAAVSGALDRLHYEKDPCVRFCSEKKLWIYLHRYRSLELFDEMHHLQIKASSVRKKLMNVLEKGPALHNTSYNANPTDSRDSHNETLDNINNDDNCNVSSSEEDNNNDDSDALMISNDTPIQICTDELTNTTSLLDSDLITASSNQFDALEEADEDPLIDWSRKNSTSSNISSNSSNEIMSLVRDEESINCVSAEILNSDENDD